ncbi:DUF1015 domain-containing protein [Roseiconus lacunae]|uniref:DUF1015 domain-containing protein n=1 Tax=Roseiconus lacunae TaxID=2605694 RepID=A0ABT7PF33_9BACT|nr:DUF1015 domain-containing protein [Roseiconus lacunae]MDM4014821.1 DUF1015 domain-containing protein [Roseiconus lacunae]
MPRVKPFRAVRPPVDKAAAVASVPYDVVNRAEAAQLAEGNPDSFLHVVRPDIDLPPETDPYADEIYDTAAKNFRAFMDAGTLQQDADESIFLYRQIMDGNSQIGVVACAHIDDYENNRILKHEFTRPAKEDDRTRHVTTLAAHAGPVFLTYRDHEQLNQSVEDAIKQAPLYDFTAEDGVQHTVWKIEDAESYCKALGEVPAFYVADGHHRAASAWRAGKARRKANADHTGEEEYNWFLTVLFPASQLNVLAYNRVIKDLNGQTPDQIRERLAEVGTLEPTGDPVPDQAGSFCIYLDGSWSKLTVPAGSIDHNDAINSLDVALLEKRVIRPIFGIEDVRTDPRIDFVGGIRGTGELEKKVQSGEWAFAVSMFPTSIAQLMAVSDAGEVMPPKSTWFEPKLRSGLLVHLLD